MNKFRCLSLAIEASFTKVHAASIFRMKWQVKLSLWVVRVTLLLAVRLGFEPLLGLMASILICSSHFITEGQSILASSPFWDSRAAFNLSLSLYNWQWVSESVLASSPFWDSWPYFNLFQSLYNWR